MDTNSRFFHPFYYLNVALVATYFPARAIFDLSSLQPTDMMSFGLSREQQIFACAFVFYLVKLPHMVTNDARIANLFLYFKLVVAALSVMSDLRMFLAYMLVFTLFAVFVKQPEYQGEQNCVSFKDTRTWYEETSTKNHTKWLIYCYASWADNCLHFSPVFAELSLKYGNKHLRFGKIDVGQFAGIAKRYKISIKPSTKQLPTLLLISNGQEIARMPDWKDAQYKSQGVKKVPLSLKSIEETLHLAEMNQKPKKEKEKKETKKMNGNKKNKN